MIDWIKKHCKVLGVLIPIVIFVVGGGYNFITTISEMKVNQINIKDQVSDISRRVTFLERLKMASSPDINKKVDTNSLVHNSLSLSTEQFNDTLSIIRNENPIEAMKSLEKKSYFTREQLPVIFGSPSQNNLNSKIK